MCILRKARKGMFLDDMGLLVDKTGDGGDTANREGQLAYITSAERNYYNLASLAPIYSNEWVRHPFQVPWNNWRNFTRDQATPMVAALGKSYYTKPEVFEHDALTIRSFFYSIIFRAGFMPNMERDAEGSTKYLWPHEFYDDFDDPTTRLLFPYRKRLPEVNKNGVKRNMKWADFCDIAGTPFLGTCIIAGKIWMWYWLLPLCMLNLLFSVLLHPKDEDDSWQLAIMCDVYDQFLGTKYLRLLSKRHDLEKAARKYWVENRDMPWFYEAWKMFAEQRGVLWNSGTSTGSQQLS